MDEFKTDEDKRKLVIESLILNFTRPGDLVLDNFSYQ